MVCSRAACSFVGREGLRREFGSCGALHGEAFSLPTVPSRKRRLEPPTWARGPGRSSQIQILPARSSRLTVGFNRTHLPTSTAHSANGVVELPTIASATQRAPSCSSSLPPHGPLRWRHAEVAPRIRPLTALAAGSRSPSLVFFGATTKRHLVSHLMRAGMLANPSPFPPAHSPEVGSFGPRCSGATEARIYPINCRAYGRMGASSATFFGKLTSWCTQRNRNRNLRVIPGAADHIVSIFLGRTRYASVTAGDLYCIESCSTSLPISGPQLWSLAAVQSPVFGPRARLQLPSRQTGPLSPSAAPSPHPPFSTVKS